MNSSKPNLLLLVTDQQRFDTLNANGNSKMYTPVLDRLASTGVNLQGYHSTCPVCVPSRCTLFTGRYPHSHGVRQNHTLLEAGREMHVFRVLKHAGYQIGYVGKNHFMEDAETGNFDVYSEAGSSLGSAAAEPEQNLMRAYLQNLADKGMAPGKCDAAWRGGFVHDDPPEATRTWQTAQAGIDFLHNHAGEKPFALCLSFEDPHVPHIARREDLDRYPLDDMELYPDGGDEELSRKASRWMLKKQVQFAERASPEDKKRYIAIYRAMITWIDTQIGRVLEALDASGQRENTLIVFTSDHGDFNFEHGLAKKDLLLVDSLLRVPCIFHFPSELNAKTLPGDILAEEVDLMPTMLDLLSVPLPDGVQGRSFAPVLRGEASTHKSAVFSEICRPEDTCEYTSFAELEADRGENGKVPFNIPGDYCKSIRTPDLRYIWYSSGEEELYDYAQDRNEAVNQAANPDYARVKAELKERLFEWHVRSEDPLDPKSRAELRERYPDWNLQRTH